MKKSSIKKYDTANGEAVSEIISAVLMISLVVVGIAVISVFIMGQDTPIEIPSLSMIPATADSDLLLYHSGGDSLNRGEFVVRVDGTDYYPDEIGLISQDGTTDDLWESWDLGEILDIPGESDYSLVQVISTKGGQSSLIASSGEAIITYTPTQTGTATVTPTQTTTETPTPVPPGPLPVADFTASTVSGYAPLSVNFIDLSTGNGANITLWSWSFGDNEVSSQQNPVHVYSFGGTYNVTLTVSNIYGNDSETKSGYITVTGMPQPAAWWKFDESSGNTALDSSGNNNNGEIEGAYLRGAGACDNALYFDGETTYISVPDKSSLSATSEVTLCAWIYPEYPINKSGIQDNYRNYVSIIDKGEDDNDNYEFFLQKTEDKSRTYIQRR